MKQGAFRGSRGDKHGAWVNGDLVLALAGLHGTRKVRLQPNKGFIRVISERPDGSVAVTEIAPLPD